jgi:hypothetical protein
MRLIYVHTMMICKYAWFLVVIWITKINLCLKFIGTIYLFCFLLLSNFSSSSLESEEKIDFDEYKGVLKIKTFFWTDKNRIY